MHSSLTQTAADSLQGEGCIMDTQSSMNDLCGTPGSTYSITAKTDSQADSPSSREPKLIEAFSKLWGTDKLLVSFDGMNLTLPTASRASNQPWPHVDQSPSRVGLQCVQGILNFAPNGPEDGGLIVLKGSHSLNKEFFQKHDVLDRKTWGPDDWFGFEQQEIKWFEDRGCDVLKVCANPGDLILWDSRTVHYNALPESQNPRALICMSYSPVSKSYTGC
jgi:ectoine hydroxylase-related dioxygenase (phytanoyl-CoA dioxygenase family)